jgi:hypothetical protein
MNEEEDDDEVVKRIYILPIIFTLSDILYEKNARIFTLFLFSFFIYFVNKAEHRQNKNMRSS